MELKVENLSKVYNKRKIVSEMSFSVSQGEIMGLLGPNGAGKTTSFYMAVGLVAPDEGKIFLGKREITSYPLYKRARMGIAYLPQEPSIFRELTVEENILCVLQQRSFSRRDQAIHLELLLEEFGLKELRENKGMSLSGGERRRVEIARAMGVNPQFMFLDEPFAGVDPLAVSDIQETIKSLKEKNIGILITDHNVRETLGIVDKAVIMNKGKILLEATPEEIIRDPVAKEFYLGKTFEN